MMLWSVEISSVGKGDVLDVLSLEASNWQAALKEARAQRGDGATLEGLSVEFLEGGCRAIDSAKRIRYVVSRQEDGEPAKVASAPPPSATPVRASVERPSISRRPISGPRTSPKLGRGVARPAGRKLSEPEPTAATEVPAPSPPEGARFELLTTRSTPASTRSPIAHHERAFALTEAVDDAELETLVLGLLGDVRAELVGTKSGNVVDIALFEAPFDGRPTIPPLVTVRWCDWRETPDVKLEPYPDYEVEEQLEDIADEAEARVEPPARVPSSIPPAPARPASRPRVAPSSAAAAASDDGAGEAEPVRTRPRPRALPKVAPLKGQTSLADAADAEPTERSRSVTEAEPGNDESEGRARPSISSKRALGSRTPLGARPATGPKPGPVAGAKPAGATRLAGGRSLGARVSPKRDASSDAVEGENGAPSDDRSDSEPPPARLSTRSVVTVDAEPPSGRVVAASAGGFESTPRRSAPSHSGAVVEPQFLSREEREVRHQSARIRASVRPPPEVERGSRVVGEQLIAELFESLSDLAYLSDALDGAAHVLAVAVEKLPSEAAMLSLYDLDRREFVVVRQIGGKRSSLLLRAAESSTFPERALKSNRAFVVTDAAEFDAHLDVRWTDVGIDVRCMMCAPIETAGRTFGLIELVNPHDGESFAPGDENALEYIAGQFAEFLDSKGVLLDPDAILAASEVGPRS